MNLQISNNEFDQSPAWTTPIDKLFPPIACDMALFDQNGYDLTDLEKRYDEVNGNRQKLHRTHRTAIKQDWLMQSEKDEGAVLNHSMLLERKSYSGAALEQLHFWARSVPLVYKIISIRAKWGLDFSMDYVDRKGNTFEVLHWEFDGFEFDEIELRRIKYQEKFASIDWDDAAHSLLLAKDKWHNLDFFAQSEWKCGYFGIESERFKQVIWE